ncbi:hypothetical protein U879_10460 [Defluviimonas sp. 20V17]|uniref:Uncharacterized conserved protein, DUF1330 family n=1 Tax=Allgaiera indica TaxID=765699 RepID=A0AAN4UQD8_9RHOB|nr:DUF1330 domain-containing protein [Allgaiera indica]KDB03745.1 hypothetical protein U879_10460 [Defluviimonas sp. 20V17]GHD99907.1 hypothetical protein GCM10008024_09500 [Allgaiera indica]SDW40901.1 Uncharacterized conserved protein, DUF1330 family [Allgaiera indica]
MPKGYWVAHVDVGDPEVYAKYRDANAAPFAEYGARFLVRGGTATQMEGDCRARTVVIEFPTIEAAKACYESAGYQAAKAIRDPVSTGDLVIVEGWEG